MAIASAATFAIGKPGRRFASVAGDLRFAILAGGRSCQRSQKRYKAKKGTNQPKLYCSLTDHSPLSSLQSSNQRAAKNKTVSAPPLENRRPYAVEAPVNSC